MPRGRNRYQLSNRQVEFLKQRVNDYNYYVEMMQDNPIYTQVPLKTTYQREISLISNQNEYEDALARMRRVMSNESFNAVEWRGEIVPQYLKVEIERSERMRDEHKRSITQAHFGDRFDTMSMKQKLALAEQYDVFPGVEGASGEYYWALQAEKHSKELQVWYENYEADIIENMPPGDRERMLEIIDRFMEEKPWALDEILSRGDPDAMIHYIYEDSPDWNDPDETDKEHTVPEKRRNAALKYWIEREEEYF